MGGGQGKGKAETVTAEQINNQLLERAKSVTLDKQSSLKRTKSLAESLIAADLPMELGYQYLDYDHIRMLTVQFKYLWDPKAKVLRVLNDASVLTVSKFSWSLFDQHLYNIKIEDTHNIDMTFNKDGDVKGKKENAIPEDLKIPFDIDIARAGEYMGMDDLDGIMDKTYTSMGVRPDEMTRRVREAGLDYIEKSIVHMWNGLLEYWLSYRQARHEPKKQEQLKQKLGIITQNYSHQNKHDMTSFMKEKVDEKSELRQFFEKKLSKDKDFKNVCMMQAQPHPNVKQISRIQERDQENGSSDRKWVPNKPKFLDLESKRRYKTEIYAADFRPWLSEQWDNQKIVFTLDD